LAARQSNPENKERFQRAIAAIDAANNADPNLLDDGGAARPAALVYSERMTAVLADLYPNASELLCLAARAQHIRRWTIPRSSYPMDRQGYLQWRNELKRFHAGLAGKIMEKCGYDSAEIGRVQFLLRKESLKRDAESQALEDAACIVFLKYYAEEFAAKHSDEKLITILRKTLVKMSGIARKKAIVLPLPERLRTLLGAALAADHAGP